MKAKAWVGMGATFILMIAFQNCAKPSFKNEQAAVGASTSDTVDEVDNVDHPIVICDPFSAVGACGSSTQKGLVGSLYTLPETYNLADYFAHGEKLPVVLQLTELNIPPRNWSAGFPAGAGSVLKDSRGQVLTEFFAMDLRGFLTPTSNLTGSYQFALHSDDGSILDLDGQEIVEHDGRHAPTWKCASSPVQLTAGQKIPMRLRYFQGPREQIALQVFMRPWSERGNPCSNKGGWTILPGATLSN